MCKYKNIVDRVNIGCAGIHGPYKSILVTACGNAHAPIYHLVDFVVSGEGHLLKNRFGHTNGRIGQPLFDQWKEALVKSGLYTKVYSTHDSVAKGFTLYELRQQGKTYYNGHNEEWQTPDASVEIDDRCLSSQEYWVKHGTCPQCRDGSIPECVAGSFVCRCGWRG